MYSLPVHRIATDVVCLSNTKGNKNSQKRVHYKFISVQAVAATGRTVKVEPVRSVSILVTIRRHLFMLIMCQRLKVSAHETTVLHLP